MNSENKKVFSAINKVQSALSIAGISKDRKNSQQNYAFRGIDDVYNVISKLLAQNNLVILPSYSDRTVTERETKSGSQLFYVTVRGDFTFVSSEDGSTATVATFGEAMDSADKATNKAMSAAFKYACLQTFCIPTEGDNDADATTHEVAARNPEAPAITAEQLTTLTNLSLAAEMHDKIQKALSAKGMNDIKQLNSEQADKLITWIKKS